MWSSTEMIRGRSVSGGVPAPWSWSRAAYPARGRLLCPKLRCTKVPVSQGERHDAHTGATRAGRHLRRLARHGAGRPLDQPGRPEPARPRARGPAQRRTPRATRSTRPGSPPSTVSGSWGAGRSGAELKEHLETAGYESARPSGWDPAARSRGSGHRRRARRGAVRHARHAPVPDDRRRAAAGVLPRLQRLARRVLRVRARPAARTRSRLVVGRRRGGARARTLRGARPQGRHDLGLPAARPPLLLARLRPALGRRPGPRAPAVVAHRHRHGRREPRRLHRGRGALHGARPRDPAHGQPARAGRRARAVPASADRRAPSPTSGGCRTGCSAWTTAPRSSGR